MTGFLDELSAYRAVQRIAYECVQWVEGELSEGATEKDAAQLMRQYLEARDIRHFFHLPFAWFGDRTCFRDFSAPLTATASSKRRYLPSLTTPLPHFGLEFQPTSRRLEPGMAVILDVAPAVDGHAADIGYSFGFGDCPEVDEARRDLLQFRGLILRLAKDRCPMGDIYAACDRLMEDLGYDNRHSMYPMGVLGHRLGRLPLQRIPQVSILGFPLQSLAYLGGESLRSKTQPFWNGASTHTLSPGLWAVEPHLGRETFGVKFEEILVVTEDDVYWADDDLPHVQFARSRPADLKECLHDSP